MTGGVVVAAPCVVCGWEARGWLVAYVRPAMRSVRVRLGLGVCERVCVECGGPTARLFVLGLDAATERAVEAWRDRQRARRQERRAAA